VTRPNQGLSSLTPGGGKMRDPGKEVAPPLVAVMWQTSLANMQLHRIVI